jgi:hypothetical protein
MTRPSSERVSSPGGTPGPGAENATGPAWSIGIYTGPSPLELSPAPGVSQPVVTAADVSDVPADFVADPFLVYQGARWYLFFEVMPRGSDIGVIGVAESEDGFRWRYKQVVLRESFHLSYPYVFSWRGDYYMTPETITPHCVRLYRAARFPDRWEHVADLIEGHHADPSPFEHAGDWWLFSCTPPGDCETLRLYRAEVPGGPWTEHPKSPVIEHDRHFARPAGRVVPWGGGLIRFTQDCAPRYGMKVWAFVVTALSRTDYREELAHPIPIVALGAHGWNERGMHHVDAHPYRGNGWIAAVDGYV